MGRRSGASVQLCGRRSAPPRVLCVGTTRALATVQRPRGAGDCISSREASGTRVLVALLCVSESFTFFYLRLELSAIGRDRAGRREGALVECDRPELRMRGARDPERRRARAARGCPPRCRVAQLTHRVCATATQLLPKARGRGRVAIGGGWRGEGSRRRSGASAARAAEADWQSQAAPETATSADG